MTPQIAKKFQRINFQLEGIKAAVQKNDPIQAMLYCCEIGVIARQLYDDFAKVEKLRIFKNDRFPNRTELGSNPDPKTG